VSYSMMNKNFPLFIIRYSLFIIPFCGQAADNYPVGGRSAALANASITITDLWACFNNQAALAYLSKTTAGASFDEQFAISNLSTEGFALALPTKAGTFGLSGNEFGYTAYNEKKVGLAFGKKLGEKISAGVQVDYLNTFINDDFYGSKTTFAVEGGLLAEPIQNFKIGFHIFNPTRAKLAEYADERIPTIIRLGGSYKFSEKVWWSAEEEKDIDLPAVFKSGIEYHIVESLFLRVGVGTNPALFSFGFGLRVKQFTIDAASVYYQVLGFSPSFSISYDFK
jgi:hypothetical protein